MDERLTATVSGTVQGVGFRWWTRRQAQELGLVGSAVNSPDGAVEVVAEGPRAALGEFLERLSGPVPDRPGRVSGVEHRFTTAEGLEGFATG